MKRSAANAIDKGSSGPDPVDIHVGKQLRYLRISRRMSQERLGSMVDLTFQQIQKYEKGTNRISASVLFRLAKALEIPVRTFFEGLNESPALHVIGDEPIVESLIATAAELQQLDDEEVRVALANLIRVLAKAQRRRAASR